MSKTAFFCDGRANWASISAILPYRSGGDVLVLAGSACSSLHWALRDEPWSGETVRLPSLVAGDDAHAACISQGATVAAMGQWLASREEIDTVYLVGDRALVLAAAQAARMHGRRIVHQMGGERSGTLDDWWRDAITMLADVHCVATDGAYRAVRAMVGVRGAVHRTGCPRIDHCRRLPSAKHKYAGLPIVALHPDTAEPHGLNRWRPDALDELRAAMPRSPWVVLWPNSDHWGGELTDLLKRVVPGDSYTHRQMAPIDYMHALRDCQLLVGNTSSGIREGAYLGTPYVLVGGRQRGRERSANVHTSVTEALTWGQLPFAERSSSLYGNGSAGARIAEVIG